MSARTQVKFAGDRRWWTTRAEDDRFAILTRQAAFEPEGIVCYTIVDKHAGHRGPCNLIGQGWGFERDTLDEDAAKLLAALQPDSGYYGHEMPLEISYRNRVATVITATRTVAS